MSPVRGGIRLLLESLDGVTVLAEASDNHHAQLMDRLGIHDVAGLVRYAIRIRLITEDGSGSG
ncbi:MAG: hypothetical protein ABIP64_08405 [Burkholderiales bacterium]